MKTIEELLEETTGLNAMDMMKCTDEEFESFFAENGIEWIRNLLKTFGGNWETEVSEEGVKESKS